MTKFKYLSLILFSSLLLFSCNSKPSSTINPISLSSTNSPFTVSADNTSKTGIINFAYKNTHLEFEVPLENSSLSKQNDSSLSFSTPKKEIEINYHLIPNGLKEDIILNRPSPTNVFQSHLKITNTDIYLNQDKIFVFYDSKSKQYLYHFQKPFAIDAKGQRTENVTYQLIQNNQPLVPSQFPNSQKSVSFSNQLNKLGSGSEFTLLINVDPSWLSDPSRSYPVTIDPTIITDSYTSTTYINTSASSNYKVTGGQLKINITSSSCWGTSGSCNSNCQYSQYYTDPYSDYYTTYVNSTSCTGYVGNTYINTSSSCSTDGSGACFLTGTQLNCFCDYTGSPCSQIYSGYDAPGAYCTFYPVYYTSATVQSTNLLSGSTAVNTIDSFQYSLSSLPGGTSVGVKFSQNASTWYSSTGGVGASDTLSVGTTNSINLSALNWTGPNFYYRFNFLSTGSSTPVFDSVSVTYSPPSTIRFGGVKMEGVLINPLTSTSTPSPVPTTPLDCLADGANCFGSSKVCCGTGSLCPPEGWCPSGM